MRLLPCNPSSGNNRDRFLQGNGLPEIGDRDLKLNCVRVESRIEARRIGRGADGRLWVVVERRDKHVFHTEESRRSPALRSESSSYLLHSEIETPSQKKSQRSTVLVPDFCGDLFDACVAGFQEMHRAFNSQTLKIRHRRFPKDAL